MVTRWKFVLKKMSKTLLLNNTSKYHKGCAKVIETFTFDDSIETNDSVEVNFSEYSKVILNGEGTMHHTKNGFRRNPIKFMKALLEAQKAGCETQIVNSVWQEMTNEFDDMLGKCSVIEVRDVLSQRELQEKHHTSSIVKPDRSLIPDVPYEEYEHVDVYEGQWFFRKTESYDYPGKQEINIFKQSWNEIVNRLRHATVLVTGRHHEAYAAIKAGCKFVVLPGNTHKNEGIYLNAGVQPINTLDKIDDVIAGKYNKEFQKIHEYYNQKRNN